MRHVVHVVRVLSVLPDVYDPAAHVVHLSAAPALLNNASSPQVVQVLVEAAENVPARHWFEPLLPSHVDPAGHAPHADRVVAEPPDVNEPAVHVLH